MMDWHPFNPFLGFCKPLATAVMMFVTTQSFNPFLGFCMALETVKHGGRYAMLSIPFSGSAPDGPARKPGSSPFQSLSRVLRVPVGWLETLASLVIGIFQSLSRVLLS